MAPPTGQACKNSTYIAGLELGGEVEVQREAELARHALGQRGVRGLGRRGRVGGGGGLVLDLRFERDIANAV